MPYYKLKLPLNTAQSYAKPWCGLGRRAYIPADLVPWGDQPQLSTSTTNLYPATTLTSIDFSSILHAATALAHGGARSFPATRDDSVPQYQAPTTAYQKVFFTQASRPSQSTPNYSAGWLAGL